MKSLKAAVILVLLYTLVPSPMMAKNDHDLASWLYADATWNKNKWALTGGLEYRANKDLSRTDLYSFCVFGKYRSSQHLRLSMGYEFFMENDGEQNYDISHRLLWQAELFFNVQNFKFVNRTSLLDAFSNLVHPNWGARDRLMISYPVSRFEPYVYTEVYLKFKDSDIKHQKNRYVGGVNYALNDRNSVSLYYMAECMTRNSFTNHVIGMSYSLALE